MYVDPSLEPEMTQAPPEPYTPSVERAVERGRTAHRIVGIYEEEVTKEVGGRPITCRGSEENPAVLLEAEDGARALALASELEVI